MKEYWHSVRGLVLSLMLCAGLMTASPVLAAELSPMSVITLPVTGRIIGSNGAVIVFVDSSYNVKAYDILSGTTINYFNLGKMPTYMSGVSGNYAVFVNNVSNYPLYLLNLSTGAYQQIDSYVTDVSIDGDYVAYTVRDFSNYPYRNAVKLYRISTGTIIDIAQSPFGSYWYVSPSVKGGRVAWVTRVSWSDSDDYYVDLYDIPSGTSKSASQLDFPYGAGDWAYQNGVMTDGNDAIWNALEGGTGVSRVYRFYWSTRTVSSVVTYSRNNGRLLAHGYGTTKGVFSDEGRIIRFYGPTNSLAELASQGTSWNRGQIKVNKDLFLWNPSNDTICVYAEVRPVQNLTVQSVTTSSVTLTWNNDPLNATATYEVKRGPTVVYTGTANTFTDTGLTPSTSYTYTVRVKEGPVVSSSVTVTGVTLAAQPVAAAYSSITSTSLQANWGANSNSANTEYHLVLEDPSTGALLVDAGWATGTSRNVTGLSVARAYRGKVQARNSNLIASGWTDLGVIYTLANQPTSLGFSGITQTSLILSWSNNGNPGDVAYRVERSADGTNYSQVWSGTGTTFADTGLSAGAMYYYRVRAQNGNGVFTSYSPPASTRLIPPTPPAPTGILTGLSWSTTAGRGRVQLSWPAMTGAIGYKVWVFDGYTYRAFDVGNTTSWDSQAARIYPPESQLDGYGDNTQSGDLFYHNNGGLDLRDDPVKLYRKTVGTTYDNSHNYWFRVSAYNASGESPQSNAYMPTLPNRTDTAAPTGSLTINDGMAKTGSTSVTLTISGSDPLVANYTSDTSDDASGVAQMSFSNDNVSWTPWEPYATTKSWTLQSGPGTKTVYMKLMDAAGNVSNIISGSIYLADDTKAPEVTLSINQGAETTTSNLVNLLINATDDLTPVDQLQMRLSNNGTSWTSWAPLATTYSNWNITSGYGATSGDGYKTVYLQVMDSMGNVNTTSAKIGYSTTPPTGSVSSTSGTSGTITVGGSNINAIFTRSAQVTANLTQTGAAKVRYSMDGITWSPWEDVGTSRVLSFPSGDGIKTVFVQYQNAYGLTSAVTQQTFVVDTTPPDVRVSTVTGATAVRASSVNLLVDVQDNLSTTGFSYQYSLNGGAWQNATLSNGQITVSGLTTTNTLYNIAVKVTDQAGNAGTASIKIWRLP